MSNIQFILTIAVCAAATMLTRFLPFLVFGSRGGRVPEVVTPEVLYVQYFL